MADQIKQEFFIIPRKIFAIKGMSLCYVRMYEILYFYYKSNPDHCVTYSDFSRNLDYSQTRIEQGIRFFLQHKYMIKHGSGYKLNQPSFE